MHNLTDLCWKRCITSRISSGKLDQSEETCTMNCVERFVDANVVVFKKLETMRRESSL